MSLLTDDPSGYDRCRAVADKARADTERAERIAALKCDVIDAAKHWLDAELAPCGPDAKAACCDANERLRKAVKALNEEEGKA